MSVSSQQAESGSLKLTAFEVAELLLSLGISPPQSLNEGLHPTPVDSWREDSTLSGSLQTGRSEDFDDDSDNSIPIIEDLDRETIIERLQIAKDDVKFIKWKNNYFHEYLAEHFKRKQMTHVYTDEGEDDILLNEYLRKLDELEKSNEELRTSQEEWDVELSKTRTDIREKKKVAKESVNVMLSREEDVGTSTWDCGKPLGLKKVQALINRQLDRIKDIAKFRLRYTRLRDELIVREVELNSVLMSSPNLTKQDYERLAAEQFYYKRELMSKENLYASLIACRSQMADRIEATQRRIIKITHDIDRCQIEIADLRDSVKTSLKQRRIWLTKLFAVKRFINEFHEVIEQSNRPEFTERMNNIRKEHEGWMKTISRTLRDIKDLGQSLNAVRANLILHGKKLEPGITNAVGEGNVDKKKSIHSPP